MRLVLRELVVGYDAPVASADVDVEFTKLAIVGDNGGGKTTLLRTIGGIIEPQGGSVEGSWRVASYVGHRSALYPGMTVERSFEFWRRARGADAESWGRRVRELLDRFDFTFLLGKQAHELSRGQHQICTLVTSLAGDPEAVLWDEPSSGIDRSRRGALWQVVDELLAAGSQRWRLAGVLFTTHLGSDLEGCTVVEGGAGRRFTVTDPRELAAWSRGGDGHHDDEGGEE